MELHNRRTKSAPSRRLGANATRTSLEPTFQDGRVKRQEQGNAPTEPTRAAHPFGAAVADDREALAGRLHTASVCDELNTRSRLEHPAHSMLAEK